MKNFILFTMMSALLLSLPLAPGGEVQAEPALKISGRVIHGQRQIEIDSDGKGLQLHVYRGDYVRLIPIDGDEALLQIDSLSISVTLPLTGEKSYLKFKQAGTFALTLDDRAGVITVHDFTRSNYFEVKSREAGQLIDSVDPLVLDVRTEFEYMRGHLKDAYLLPVRGLKKRIGELQQFRERPILIYCRSGNRSTVAAKILLDNGFERVYNLRYGIKEWNREQMPTVK
jgi:rhodanese-related sulfurtransferase